MIKWRLMIYLGFPIIYSFAFDAESAKKAANYNYYNEQALTTPSSDDSQLLKYPLKLDKYCNIPGTSCYRQVHSSESNAGASLVKFKQPSGSKLPVSVKPNLSSINSLDDINQDFVTKNMLNGQITITPSD